MNRRDFLKRMGALGLVTAAAPVIFDMGKNSQVYRPQYLDDPFLRKDLYYVGPPFNVEKRELVTPAYSVADIQSTREFKEVFGKIVENLYRTVDHYKEVNISENYLTAQLCQL